jgi:TIR domain
MSYLAPHFDPDVFVSYSSGDPQGVASPLRDWTLALIGRLNDHIRNLDTEFENLTLWIDREVDPSSHLTDETRSRASRSGVLLIVMTKRFLQSSWCREELEWFRREAQGRAAQAGRVFIIRAQQTDTNHWPDFLRDERGYAMPGFSFYDPEYGVPWGWPDGREPGADYLKQLLRLQMALIKRLRDLRERGASRVMAPGPDVQLASARPKRIYLHAVSGSGQELAEIRSALEIEGILPLTVAGAAEASFLDWKREAAHRFDVARRCDALVLLRSKDSDRFVADLIDIGVDERERIAAARGVPMPCAVLDKTGEKLPLDVSQFGIQRFDVNEAGWRDRFHSWLDASGGAAAGGHA